MECEFCQNHEQGDTLNSPSGTFHYSCGICGEPVGIHSGNCKHIADGWLYKRDCCKNGHAVDWAAYEKEGELNE